VYKGTVHDRDEVIVIKDQKVTSNDSIKNWQREVALMQYIPFLSPPFLQMTDSYSLHRHPHIADVYGFAFDSTTLSMIMEYVPKGSLFGKTAPICFFLGFCK
jgi:hypothetical protein